ncbi:hypothetical protein, partial [Edaphovirga cremea]|uniref:hypothetical protein n=1 Tax=Edaphovirga cremea TaxID=2267246 RepID=UPI001B86AF44
MKNSPNRYIWMLFVPSSDNCSRFITLGDENVEHPHFYAKGANSGLPLLLCTENLQLGWRFRKAFSFEPVIKTPFDLLKQFAVWQLQTFNK